MPQTRSNKSVSSICLFLIAAVFLTGCSSSSQNSNDEPASETPEQEPAGSENSDTIPEQNEGPSLPEDSSDTITGLIHNNAHQTDFLTAGFFTHLYPSFNNAERASVRTKMLASGYTHIYIYIMNQNDYGGPEFDFYQKPTDYLTLLKELNNSGLQPVVWLAPDDAPDLVEQYHTDELVSTWEQVIPLIDPYVSSYVLGLEMDEYWSDEEQNLLGTELNKLTEKTLFVHMRARIWEQVLLPWADGIIYQYGFGNSPEEIFQDTTLMLQRLEAHPEKILIAGEYSFQQTEEESRSLGDAGINAGAQGFGNGGSPF